MKIRGREVSATSTTEALRAESQDDFVTDLEVPIHANG